MGNSDTTLQIKEKLDIVDFLKDYLTLIPSGKNFKAVCPFHKEKTPSFMVSPDRQTWHCFGACNTGGDVFSFLMRYEDIEFFEALKILAERTQIELRKIDPAVARQFGVLYDIHVGAKNYFISEFSKNKEALNYILGRGLTNETIEKFEIGLAPIAKDALTVFLLKQGFHIDDILRSGIAVRSDHGGYYDRFRGRIMFPLLDHFGKVVAFTGRILPQYDDGTMAKYLNSPETPIFKKSKLFYGFDKAKSAIRESRTAFLVEGQMDLVLSHQDGVKNVLATSGTALTEDHLAFLRRVADKLILCFDADEAGGNAIERAIDMAASYEYEVKVVQLTGEAKDPADFIVANPGKLSRLLDEAVPAMEFYFSRYLSDGFPKKNIQLVLQKIRALKSSIDRARGLKSLSERVGISELNLREEFDRLDIANDKKEDYKVSSDYNGAPDANINIKDRRSLLAESLIRLALINNDMKIVEEVKDYLPLYHQEIVGALISGGADVELQKTIDLLSFQPDFILTHSREDLCREIKLEYLIEEKSKLAAAIKVFEKNANSEGLEDVIKKFDLLSKQIHNLKN